MGFAYFLKIDLKKSQRSFLNESFDPYYICFRLPDGKKFLVTTFDAYATLGVPIRGRYGPELQEKLYRILGELLFHWTKESLLQQVCLEIYEGQIRTTTGLHSTPLAIGQPNSEAPMPAATSLAEASVTTDRDDTLRILGLGLSQPHSQRIVLVSTSVPDPNTTGEKDIDNADNDDDGALLRIPLRNASQVSHESRIKKSRENNSKVGKKPTPKKMSSGNRHQG
ncbi:LOW QUALITY PROTEIN: hypothetical protein Cgig2_016478 [Carnegiea gigantea]|uniref:Uncharacterized protein n=1 Tax=Carnegiea gigantea TaxID=171969 RepID=A0A9Q1GNN9_9CARY|nr:LOW QUALITY PROTEIN: hypothetical protein Cgig2_016478 [Carnegiea gigantea]